jgi:hypothetical protein
MSGTTKVATGINCKIGWWTFRNNGVASYDRRSAPDDEPRSAKGAAVAGRRTRAFTPTCPVAPDDPYLLLPAEPFRQRAGTRSFPGRNPTRAGVFSTVASASGRRVSFQAPASASVASPACFFGERPPKLHHLMLACGSTGPASAFAAQTPQHAPPASFVAPIEPDLASPILSPVGVNSLPARQCSLVPDVLTALRFSNGSHVWTTAVRLPDNGSSGEKGTD